MHNLFIIRLVLTSIIAFGITYLCTPIVRKIAIKIGHIDQPSKRKIHLTPIPQLGGLAIYIGFIAALLLSGPIDQSIIAIIIGATIIMLVGIFDDFRALNPFVKLFAQVIIAIITVKFGIIIHFITNPFGGGVIYLGWLAIPLTILWIVGLTNTINLIDGLDGLAAGVSAISAFIIAIVAFAMSQHIVAILAMSIFGSSIAFLKYNFSPAKIFMGDGGSMFLGYILATLTIIGVLKTALTMSLTIPLLIFGVPIADTLAAILRRIKNKQNVFHPDQKHIHHRLINSGLSQKQAALCIYCTSSFLGILALAICFI